MRSGQNYGMTRPILLLRLLRTVSAGVLLWTVLIAPTFGQEYQTVIFDPPTQICVDAPPFELNAESFDFEGGDLRVMSFNIHTGIGGYAATTSGGISTQYTQPDLWPLIIEEIADRIHEQDLDIFGLQEVIGGKKTVNDGLIGRRDSEQSEIIKQTLNELEGAEVWDYQFWTHNIGQSGSSTGGDWWGVATFYRSPWTLVGDPEAFPTSNGSDTKAMIKTTLTNGMRTIDVFTAHLDVDLPKPANGSTQYSERNAAPFLAAAENPVILIGDLNVEPQHTMPDGTLQLKPLWDLGLVDSAVSSGLVSAHGVGPGPSSLHTRHNVYGLYSKRIDWVVLQGDEFRATGVEVYQAMDDPSTTMPSPHPSIAAGVNTYPEQQETSYISDHHAFIADISMRGAATGLPVTYSSSNPDIISISGSTATIRGSGTVELSALQAGNESFQPSTIVRRKVQVNGPSTVLIDESFETDGNGVRYDVYGAAEALSRAYFHRRMGDHIFTAPDGQWYFGGENIDGQTGHVGYDDGDSTLDNPGKGAVLFEPVSISGLGNLEVVLNLGASDRGGFDTSKADGDKVSVDVRIDDGSFEEIARFSGSGKLIAPDGIAVSTDFSDWTLPFEMTGEMLQLRIVLRSTSGIGNEVLAFDHVRLIGRENVRPEDLLPIGGACNPIPDLEDWFESPWFGAYNTTFAPWIFHSSHNYIYIDPSSIITDVYFFDPVIDSWIYTDPAIYPNLYSFDGQGWLYFYTETVAPRVFYRYQDQAFIYYD